MSTGVGGFVQRTIRKAGFPWRIIKAQSSLPSRSALSKFPTGRSQSIDEEIFGNDSQEPHVDQVAVGSMPESQPVPRVPSVEIERIGMTDRPVECHRVSSLSPIEIENTESIDSPPYTDGPSQIVMSNDGTKDCLAILLNQRIVLDLNEINDVRHRLEVAKEKYRDIEHEVAINEIFVEGSIENLEITKSEEERSRIIMEVEDRKAILLKDTETRDSLKELVNTEQSNLHYLEALSHDTFKKLLNDAGLLNPPKPETEAILLNQKNLASRADSITSAQRSESVLSLEALNREATIEELELRSNELRQLWDMFEDRHTKYDRERQEWANAVLEGQSSITQTQFDNIMFCQEIELTEAIGETEAAHEDAMTRARKLGLLKVTWDQESNFTDDVDDGYRISFEDEMKTSVDRRFINAWMDGVSEPQDSQGVPSEAEEAQESHDLPPEIEEAQDSQASPPETERTEVLKSPAWNWQPIGFFGSLSTIFEFPEQRRRATRWQNIIEVEREEAERLRIKFVGPQLPESGRPLSVLTRRHSIR